MLKTISSVCLSLSVIFLISITKTPAQTITWNCALSVFTPGSTYQWNTETELPFRVEKATRGRLKIVTHKEMVKAADVLDAVRDRRVDMGIQGSMYRGDTALLNYVAIPAILSYETLPEIHHKVRPVLQEALKDNFGVVMLGQGYWSRQTICSKKPANTFAALKGLKFRSSSYELTRLMQAIGGAPVDIAHSDIYVALEKGVIEGAQSSLASIMGKKWSEVAKYVNWWPVGNACFYFIANKESFEALPADLKKILVETVSGLGLETWGGSYIDDVKNRADSTTPEYNLINLYPPEKEIAALKKMVGPVIEDWKKRAGPRSEKIMAIINSTLGTKY